MKKEHQEKKWLEDKESPLRNPEEKKETMPLVNPEEEAPFTPLTEPNDEQIEEEGHCEKE